MIEKYLKEELEQLDEKFKEKFPKYGQSWRGMGTPWLFNRLKGEVKELKEAVFLREIRDEALDVALIALFIVNECNEEEEGDEA